MKTFIRKHPLWAYLFITIFISYLLGIPFNGWISSFLQTEHALIRMYAPILITILGPALAALLVQWGREGKKGAVELLKKLGPQKQNWAGYFLIPAVAFLLAFSVFALQGIPVMHMLQQEGHWLVLQLAAQFLLVGIGEELGWRGWLQPYFTNHFPLLKASLLTAMIWGLWHLPKLFISLQVSLAFILSWVALSVLFSWMLYRLKMNVLLVALGHAAFNSPIFFLENRLATYQLNAAVLTDSLLLLSLLYFSLMLILMAADRKFWRETATEVKKQLA